jgi:hypothetical protein
MIDVNMPARSAALRLAILLCLVCALDAAAAFLLPHPRIWCAAVIPSLMLLSPFVLWRWEKK